MTHSDGSVGLTTRVVGLAACGGGLLLLAAMQWYEAARSAGWLALWWLMVLAGMSLVWTGVVRWQIVAPIRGLTRGGVQGWGESESAPRRDFPAELRALDQTIRDVLRNARAVSEEEKKSANALRRLVGSLAAQSRALGKETAAQAKSLEASLQQSQTLDDHLRRLGEAAGQLVGHSDRLEKNAAEFAELLSGGQGARREVGVAVSGLMVRGREILHALEETESQVHLFERAMQTTSPSVARVNDLAKEVTGSALELERCTGELNQIATEGGKVVKEVDSHSRDTTQAVLESAKIVRDLGSRSEEIGAVVEVIESIADETNLLALNAAIIAAQAGEHGKSFAVVADEIRELAERTSSSTKEVAELVKGVQDGIGQATQSIHQSADKVRQSADLAEQAGEIWERVREESENNAKLAERIAASSSEQCRGTDRLAGAIEAVVNAVDGIGRRIRGQRRIEDRASHDLAGLQTLMKESETLDPRTSDLAGSLRTEVKAACELIRQVVTCCSRGSDVSEGMKKRLDEAWARTRRQNELLEQQGDTLQLSRDEGVSPAKRPAETSVLVREVDL